MQGRHIRDKPTTTRASARPAYAGFYQYIPVNVSPVPVKNIVTSTKYRLKQSILRDLLEIIFCTLGPEASGSSCSAGSSSDVQQAKQWTRKRSLTLATKLSLIVVCKGWVVSWYKISCFSHISTEDCTHHYSETRSRSNVNGTYACWKTLIKLTFSMERLYRLTEGWYQNISLLPVLHTDSLNNLR